VGPEVVGTRLVTPEVGDVAVRAQLVKPEVGDVAVHAQKRSGTLLPAPPSTRLVTPEVGDVAVHAQKRSGTLLPAPQRLQPREPETVLEREPKTVLEGSAAHDEGTRTRLMQGGRRERWTAEPTPHVGLERSQARG
jgi:hypothetical protein